jgi:hypothetical protein
MLDPSYAQILLLHALECKNKSRVVLMDSSLGGFGISMYPRLGYVDIRYSSTDLGALGISTIRRSKLPHPKMKGIVVI